MFRKDLIPLLHGRSLTLREIAHLADQKMSDTEEDLKHLFRSLKHTDAVAQVEPALCKKCGFEFGPDKLHKPSKCPKCHATWLSEPRITIRQGSSSKKETEETRGDSDE
ncbi:MAG: transcriptional regulator [Verrucomicrobiales bacterium]